MITDTVKLTEIALAKVADKVKAANRIAKRAGLAPVSYKVIGNEQRIYKDSNGFDYKITFYAVQVTGEPIKVEGWEFVASIEHTENGNIIHTHSDSHLPNQYRTSDSHLCEVCHTNRERKQTYIVRKENEYKQVGSTCLKDFFGVNVNAVAKMYDEWFSLGQYLSEPEDMDEYINGGGHYEINLLRYMAYTVKVINENGYVSRKNADMGKPSTCDMVGNYMDMHEAKYEPSDADIAEAKSIIEFAQGMKVNENNDYEWNLSVLVKNEYVSPKSYGIAASIPAWVGRAKEQERKAQTAEVTQSFFGTVGEKVTVNITVTVIKSINTQWGCTWLYKMINSEGQNFTWFGTPEKMSEGCTATVTGTIKDHVKFNGELQTQLTRCKVTNLKEA
jgi:hypothetical protein